MAIIDFKIVVISPPPQNRFLSTASFQEKFS